MQDSNDRIRISAVLSAVVLLTCTSPAHAGRNNGTGPPIRLAAHYYNYSSCAALDQKIEHLKDRRREGYSVREGERLKKRLREARERWRELDCRRTSVKPSA